MNSNYFVEPTEEELILAHHGILGQKWGIRRYQNPDGSLTEAGLRRYGSSENLKKIQDARADAKAYKIRNKAIVKAEKKKAKMDYKQEKKLLKLKRDENEKAANEEKERKDKEYKERHKHDGAKEVFGTVIKPVALAAGREMLSRYTNNLINDAFTDEATKMFNKTVKELSRQAEITRYRSDISRNEMNETENRIKSSKEYVQTKYNSDLAKMRADTVKNYAYANENYYKTDDDYRERITNTNRLKAKSGEVKAKAEHDYLDDVSKNYKTRSLAEMEYNREKYDNAYNFGGNDKGKGKGKENKGKEKQVTTNKDDTSKILLPNDYAFNNTKSSDKPKNNKPKNDKPKNTETKDNKKTEILTYNKGGKLDDIETLNKELYEKNDELLKRKNK